MKKFLFSLVTLFAMTVGVYADEVTITADDALWSSTAGEQTGTKDGITISTTSGMFSTQYRAYKGSTFTVSSTVGNITKVEITCTANGTSKYGPGCFTDATSGEYSYSDAIGTWTGNATSISMTASSNQVRMTKIVVTYGNSGQSTIEKPTFSLPAGTYYGAQKVALSCATEGASIIYYIGDDPVDYNEYTEYSEPITITKSCTLNAVAYLNGENSGVASVNYTIIPLTATDKNGKEIQSKFAVSPLTVKYSDDTTGLTFKVNGKDVAYDAATGISLAHTAQKNEYDTLSIYNGEELVAERVYTWIPTVNVSTYKTLEDGSEAILKFAKGNKVSYVSANGNTVFFEDASKGIEGYNLGLTFEAYKTISEGSIWGKKTTYNGIVEITKADSTATCSFVTQTTTDVTPTALTVAQTLLENNQLRYAKVSGVQIITKDNKYYAVCASDTVQIYDSFKTNVLTSLETTPCYADVIGIVACYKDIIEIYPIALENVSDKITGVCGGVTWTIDLDGNMVFTPTDGVSGTLATTGIAATKRPWSSVASVVKTVKFETGVSSTTDNSYMFKDMKNLESIDFTNFNTTALTTTKGLFQNCENLKSVDFTALDLASVKNMAQTFDGCKALESANLSNVTGAVVTDINNMFNNCAALNNIDLRAFSTAKVSKTSTMKNFFSLAAPDTLILSKNFGAIATGDMVVLPTKKYMSATDNTKVFDLPTDADAFYAYNQGLEEYGMYVTYDPTTKIETIKTTTSNSFNTVRYNLAGQRVNANAKGIVIMNGKKMLVK